MFQMLVSDCPLTLEDMEKDPLKAKTIPTIKAFKKQVDLKDKKLLFDSHYNEVQLKMQEESLGAFKQAKMDSFWVRNFMTFFLLRYVLFCVSLVTLQHLHLFQIWVILAI